VHYDFACSSSDSEKSFEFSEEHSMRYFFEDELLAASSNLFKCLGSEEMVTGSPPSVDTWAVTYLLQRI
jgi:hypothetical protein